MSNARLRRRYRRAPWYKQRPDHGLVAVDLGKRKVGVALFTPEGVLSHAQTVHTQRGVEDWNPQTTAWAIQGVMVKQFVMGGGVPLGVRWDWVCEYPEQRGVSDRGNYHNIAPLQHVGDLLHGSVGWAEKYRPAEWKRHVKKELHHRRIGEALTASEREAVVWGSLGHDARDAVGIGLFALGRIDHIGRKL